MTEKLLVIRSNAFALAAKSFSPERLTSSSGTSIILPADALKAVSWERRDPAPASRRIPTYVSFKSGGHIAVATFPAEKVPPLRGTTKGGTEKHASRPGHLQESSDCLTPIPSLHPRDSFIDSLTFILSLSLFLPLLDTPVANFFEKLSAFCRPTHDPCSPSEIQFCLLARIPMDLQPGSRYQFDQSDIISIDCAGRGYRASSILYQAKAPFPGTSVLSGKVRDLFAVFLFRYRWPDRCMFIHLREYLESCELESRVYLRDFTAKQRNRLCVEKFMETCTRGYNSPRFVMNEMIFSYESRVFGNVSFVLLTIVT